jgi:hypothetical protein
MGQAAVHERTPEWHDSAPGCPERPTSISRFGPVGVETGQIATVVPATSRNPPLYPSLSVHKRRLRSPTTAAHSQGIFR